jgi:hypothetical protein
MGNGGAAQALVGLQPPFFIFEGTREITITRDHRRKAVLMNPR